MSSGRTHARVAKVVCWTGYAVNGALLIFGPFPWPLELLTGVAGLQVGLIVGINVTPDMDVDAGNISHAKVRYKFGKVGESAWTHYWGAYARQHKHRGSSHKLVIGTAGRWWYVLKRGGCLVWLIVLGLLWWYYLLPEVGPYLLWFALWAFLGNVIQDAGHWLFDKF